MMQYKSMKSKWVGGVAVDAVEEIDRINKVAWGRV